VKRYLRLMRIQHYIKNILILLPIVFSGRLFNINLLLINLLGVVSFSFIASFIYVINDIADVNQDKLHPVKCKRPIASGEIEKKNAVIFSIMLFIISAVSNYYICAKSGPTVWILWSIYILINFAYSFGLKKIPVVDVIILAIGFMIRVLYGGAISGIEVSFWLYFTVLSISLYMSLGKRRNELKNQGECVRKVLRYYNYKFINIFMYVFFIFILIFYTLWCVATVSQNKNLLGVYFTIPLVIFIIARYSKDIEGKVDGDPINVLLKDRVLIISGLIYMISLLFILYYNSILFYVMG